MDLMKKTENRITFIGIAKNTLNEKELRTFSNTLKIQTFLKLQPAVVTIWLYLVDYVSIA